MSDLPRSADSAYYASKTKLLFNQTREGSRNKKQFPSYRHQTNDTTGSSNKYYASQEQNTVTEKPKTISKVTGKTMKIDLSILRSGVLPQIIKSFSDGYTEIIVQGERELLQNTKNSVDMAVGRNVLTRQQADRVSFTETIKPVAKVEEKQENVVVDQIASALKSMFSADATIPAQEETPPAKKRGRKSKKEKMAEVVKLDDADDD